MSRSALDIKNISMLLTSAMKKSVIVVILNNWFCDSRDSAIGYYSIPDIQRPLCIFCVFVSNIKSAIAKEGNNINYYFHLSEHND